MVKFSGNKFKALLVELNRSQRDLARCLNIDYHRLNKWLCGKAEPKVGDVLSMLNHLGYSSEQAKELFWTLYQ